MIRQNMLTTQDPALLPSPRARSSWLVVFFFASACFHLLSRPAVARKRRQEVEKINVARSNWVTKSSSPTAHSRELSDPLREGITLTKDVFYGRAIIQVPRSKGFLGVQNLNQTAHGTLRKQLLEEFAYDKYNITSENARHVLQSSISLIAENRDPNSRFRKYLDLLQTENMLVFTLNDTQRKMLQGTTQEKTPEELSSLVELVHSAAGNFTLEPQAGSDASEVLGKPVTWREAQWAVSAILTRALTIWPPTEDRPSDHGEDPATGDSIKMSLVPIPELLYANYHPDGGTAITFQEERIVIDGQDVDVVLQIARRDMGKGEENFLYPGRLSNSDLLLRYNLTFKKNHVGIGDNSTIPGSLAMSGDDTRNMRSNKNKQRREFEKYNCTAEDFELRFSPKGYPDRKFCRCWRVNHFMESGWYSPALVKKVHLLDKWPPPPAYTDEEMWLALTQADNQLNALFKQHCKWRRARLRNGIDRATLEAFKVSEDVIDQKLYKMRIEETKTFKHCEELANRISNVESKKTEL
ncbi:unnamed protein product [Amoebophrya sp. A120]|nr:unnamed protein product [Amoebophrya sp. A120]|eukprot:GSA120T00001351001.1